MDKYILQMRKGFGPEEKKFRQALKLRKKGRNYSEISQEIRIEKKTVKGWIEGTVIPKEMNPKMAEQWRQSSLFGFASPLDKYKGRGL